MAAVVCRHRDRSAETDHGPGRVPLGKPACSTDCAGNSIHDKRRRSRILREGPDTKGGLSAGNYATITGASPATTTRDLTDLVEKGALLREGERRHARYHLAIPILRVSPVVLDEQGSFD